MWSNYQLNVFKFFEQGSGHGAINAVAGSGKSTTAVEAVVKSDINNIIILAFNKHIEVDFNEKLEQAGQFPIAKTYNAFGYRILSDNIKCKLSLTKNEDIFKYDVIGKKDASIYWKFVYNIKRVVSILKNNYVIPGPNLSRIIYQVIDDFDLSIKEKDREDFVSYASEVYKKSVANSSVIDFDDQKFQPIYKEMEFPKMDLVVVDEYQDTCFLEAKILDAVQPERLIVFGDPWQAIYSFKGTEKDSIRTFTEKYKATELPLSICYRCPKEVVREAQKIVAHMEFNPEAPEGRVGWVSGSAFIKECTDQDMVLARCNVDLVSSAMGFIRAGIPAYVRGKEVGKTLSNVVEKIAGRKSMHIEDFMSAFRDYRDKEMESLRGRNALSRMTFFEETCETIEVLTEGCTGSKEIVKKIDNLFSDEDKPGILHQSIHKSKGGEGNSGCNVYILRSDKIPHPKAVDQEEEMRIKYVGLTRVKGDGGLMFVEPPKKV